MYIYYYAFIFWIFPNLLTFEPQVYLLHSSGKGSSFFFPITPNM
jgi:hypothetical protein